MTEIEGQVNRAHEMGEALAALEAADEPWRCDLCGSTATVNRVCIECVEDGKLILLPGGWRPATRWWRLVRWARRQLLGAA